MSHKHSEIQSCATTHQHIYCKYIRHDDILLYKSIYIICKSILSYGCSPKNQWKYYLLINSMPKEFIHLKSISSIYESRYSISLNTRFRMNDHVERMIIQAISLHKNHAVRRGIRGRTISISCRATHRYFSTLAPYQGDSTFRIQGSSCSNRSVDVMNGFEPS